MRDSVRNSGAAGQELRSPLPSTSRSLLLSIVAFAVALYAAADPSKRVQFGPGTVEVRGMGPGTSVGWMALVRERVDNHIRVDIRRGVTRAGANGDARVSDKAADARRAIWSFAPLEDSDAVLASAGGYEISSSSIHTAAQAGAPAVQIVSPEVHVLYVRPPAGAWYYDATDGSDLDEDRTQNGTIAMPLSALQRLETGPPAPRSVQSGDYILIIDPRQLRSAKVVVP